jgi:hypothetical protein
MNSGDGFYDKDVLKEVYKKDLDVADIVYGDVLLAFRLDSVVQKAKPLNRITKQMVFSHQSAFVKLTLMKEKKFDTFFKNSGDYNFFYQCYKNDKHFLYVPFIIARYNAEYGASCNYVLVKYEDACIHGEERRLSWKIKYFLNCLIYNIKQIIKRLLPKALTEKIQKDNIRRLV